MANGLGSFSIGMDPRQFLRGRGSIVGNRFVPMAPTPQPVAPPPPQAPSGSVIFPTPSPMAQPVAPTSQPITPTPQPMIPEPPALPSEQLNMQPSMQEPPPMAPPVMEQPPMAPPMEQPVMEQPAMGGFFNKVFDTLRGENVTNLDQPVTSTPQPDDSMMRPMPLPPPSARPRIDNRFFVPVGTPPEFRFNNPRLDMDAPTRPLGLDGILGGFDRFRPPPPPRFGLPVGFRPTRRPFPPGFGESPMRDFREMRGIGLRNPFFAQRKQG